jgi:SnoaL-like domain
MSTGDIIEIVNVINLYALAVDTRRWDLFDRIFTPDIRTSFGGPAAWNDLVKLKRDFAIVHGPFSATMHVTTNHQVLVKDDVASCLSYVHGRFIRQLPEGGNLFESGGWYDDALVRTVDGWRIKTRSCRTIWTAGNPVVLQTMPGITGEQKIDSLSDEALSGNIGHLAALLTP